MLAFCVVHRKSQVVTLGLLKINIDNQVSSILIFSWLWKCKSAQIYYSNNVAAKCPVEKSSLQKLKEAAKMPAMRRRHIL